MSKSGSMFIENKKYFHFFNNQDCENLESDASRGKFCVSKDRIGKEGKITKIFTSFKDHFEFRKFLRDLPECERNFYEIIKEKDERKAYFDIDIKRADFNLSDEDFFSFAVNTYEKLIGAVCFLHPKINPNDFIILCGDSIETKASFHLILNNYYFKDCESCKFFCSGAIDRVMNYNPIYFKHSGIFDKKVYNKNQNFRMYLNSKKGGQILELLNPFPYRGEMIESKFINESDYTKFYDTLITVVNGCEKYEMEIVKPVKTFNREISVYFNEGGPEKILEIVNERYGKCYEIRNVKDGMISLNRIKGRRHKCEQCEKTHQNENPFILVNGENVWFDCNRRTDKRRTLICKNTFAETEIFEEEEIDFSFVEKSKIVENQCIFNWIPSGMKIKV